MNKLGPIERHWLTVALVILGLIMVSLAFNPDWLSVSVSSPQQNPPTSRGDINLSDSDESALQSTGSAQASAEPNLAAKREVSVGELSAAEISSEIARSQTHFQRCFASWLAREPQARGSKMELTLQIQSTGKAVVERIQPTHSSQETAEDPEFNICLRRVVERMQFRTFKGSGITTLLPLEFN